MSGCIGSAPVPYGMHPSPAFGHGMWHAPSAGGPAGLSQLAWMAPDALNAAAVQLLQFEQSHEGTHTPT